MTLRKQAARQDKIYKSISVLQLIHKLKRTLIITIAMRMPNKRNSNLKVKNYKFCLKIKTSSKKNQCGNSKEIHL